MPVRVIMASPIGLRRLRANRQLEASDKNDFTSCPSKVLLDFPYRRITTIFFIQCYANGPYYYFMVGLPYHRIILDNIDLYESLSIVHTDAIACRISLVGDWLKFA